MKSENNCSISDLPYCGLIKLDLYKDCLPDPSRLKRGDDFYKGFMNLKGERIINDRTYHRASNFSFNRAIIQDKDRNLSLIHI